MPRGGARAGAGRKPKAPAKHWLDGTWRPDRHGPRPVGNVVTLPAPAPAGDWRPSEADRAGLGPRACQLLDAALAEYQFGSIEGCQLLTALRSYSRLELLEDAIEQLGVVGPDGEPNALLGALARESRVFLSLWAALQLDRGK